MLQNRKECQNILQILRTRTIIYCIQSNAEIQSEKNNDKAFEPYAKADYVAREFYEKPEIKKLVRTLLLDIVLASSLLSLWVG